MITVIGLTRVCWLQNHLTELDAGFYYLDPKTGVKFAVTLFAQSQEPGSNYKNQAVVEWERGSESEGTRERGSGLLSISTLARMKKGVTFSTMYPLTEPRECIIFSH